VEDMEGEEFLDEFGEVLKEDIANDVDIDLKKVFGEDFENDFIT